MNLVNGKIIPQEECNDIIENLEKQIQQTLEKPSLDPYMVVEACNKLSLMLNIEEHEQALLDLGITTRLAKEYINDAKIMLSKKYLTDKLNTELGTNYGHTVQIEPDFYDRNVTEQIVPLGVLFHIAAGNMDGLPVFTVIEGLLAGNINILKLPVQEGGISVSILLELLQIEPLLAEYVYVFDYTSKDTEIMEKLADLADAIVVWGGDAATKAIRRMATPNTKIVEWGHKMSFAYISSNNIEDKILEGIAENICHTNQLLCSSCQGIFIDTQSMEDVYEFCERFLPILENACKVNPLEIGIGLEAQVGLRVYNEQLEAVFTDTKIFNGNNCSITAYSDMELESSILFRNPWVRRLPRNRIISTLRPYKSYLQTIGLICDENDIAQLSRVFWKTGAVRITDGYHMSKMYSGGAHDGEYPLRRYTKIIALEV